MYPDETLSPSTGAVDPGFLWMPRHPTDQPESEGSRDTAQAPYLRSTTRGRLMRGTMLSSLCFRAGPSHSPSACVWASP